MIFAPPKRLWKAIVLAIALAIIILELAVGTACNYQLASTALSDISSFAPPPTLSDNLTIGVKLPSTNAAGASSTQRRNPHHRIPLDELVGDDRQECKDEQVYVPDQHLSYEDLFSGNRKIPRIVHQTARSRCVTEKFYDVVQSWVLGDDWAHYFHSDDAIDRLFQQDWPEFPHLRTVLACIDGKGTLNADLWRYLVLWEYGGIYADVDTKPNKFNSTTITAEDDGFFIVEMFHVLSQYFMALSPRHPIMFYTIHHVLSNLVAAEDTGMILGLAPELTGPRALNQGFQSFMRDKGQSVPSPGAGKKPAKAGLWVGTDDRNITVKGRGEYSNEYVFREYIKRHIKIKEYKIMDMKHFVGDQEKSYKSCLHTLLDAQQFSSKDLDQAH